MSGTWTVDGAGFATLSGVPDGGILLGSTCAATEDTLDTPPAANQDPSYSWAEPDLDPTTITATETGPMRVTNRVIRSTGEVEVTKTVTGETLGYLGTGEAFTVGYRCAPPTGSASPMTGSATVGDGQTTALATGIPSGWSCNARERPPGTDLLRNRSYSWGPPVVSGPVTVVADDTVTITVENPITRNYGALAIRKLIPFNADAVVDDATFSGTYSCTYGAAGDPDADTFDGSWSVTGAGPATLDPAADQLPVGTACTVTENTPSGGLVDESWRWGTPVVLQPLPVGSIRATSTALVGNRPVRVYGNLDVEKVFEGGDPDVALVDDAEVTGAWECSYDGDRPEDNTSGTWTLPAAGGATRLFRADGSVTDANGDPILVPATADCTVTEDTPGQELLTDTSYAWGPVVYDPEGGEVTVPTTGTARVTVTNTAERVRLGSLVIRKIIELPAGVEHEDQGTFTGTFLCTHPGDPDYSGEWELTLPDTAEVGNILLNSTCTITEDPPTGVPKPSDISYVYAGYAVDPEDGAVVTDPAAPVEFTVTNEAVRVLTHLTVTKRLTETSATPPEGTTFDMSYTCTDQSGGVHTGSQAIAVDETWTTEDTIPVGSHCTVSESDLPELAPRFTWIGTEIGVENIPEPATTSGRTIEFDVPPLGADGPVVPAVTVTNELVRAEGGYVVTKSADPVSGSEVEPGDTITYSVTVTPIGPGVTDDVVVTDDLSDVLPYATISDIDAPQGTAAISGDTLTWEVGSVGSERAFDADLPGDDQGRHVGRDAAERHHRDRRDATRSVRDL